MLALGQVKALQLEQKRKSQLIDKATNPPMVGPSTLKNQRVSLLPGDITYIDNMSAQDGFKPATWSIRIPLTCWLTSRIRGRSSILLLRRPVHDAAKHQHPLNAG
jgi:hypothetical protein